MRLIADIGYTEGCALDVYLPEGEVRGTLIYFHGGGLEAGDKRDAAVFAPYLTARNFALIGANYRMYPAARYPEFAEDAALAVRWAYTHMGEYTPCRAFFVSGSSAGGYLSMLLCFDTHYLGQYGIDNTKITGFLHDAGQPTCHYNVLRERGIDSRRVIVDESAPLYHIGRQTAYAPMHFLVSDADLENRMEQTVLMLSTLRHFGIPKERATMQVLHGGHCHYLGETESGGDCPFGKIAVDFMEARL